ncbi:MAG: ABC transporter ATP-binding protein [Kutzneria sp.]|nr:ABC transporter ATP-binding protein [Kutzneria sp.]
MALLEVEDLHVSFRTDDGVVQAVRGVSFHLDRGETLGLVGESGSGKSVATQSITGLTRGAEIRGRALFEGNDLLKADLADLRQIRGPGIGMIFQDPLTSLHPAYRVGWQIEEMIRTHRDVSRADSRRRAVEMLGLVGIPHPSERVDDYPHQFSGGMRQRVMIAMAMALNPSLLIADEPTTALDVTIQAQILALLKELVIENGTALIMITHDLGVVAGLCDEVNVLYGGRIVERAARHELFARPRHPYTSGLLASVPRLDAPVRGMLPAIRGSVTDNIAWDDACAFAPRCPNAMSICMHVTPEQVAQRNRLLCCHNPVQVTA